MVSQDGRDVVIVSGVRTPFSKFGGVLKEVSSVDLGVIAIKEALKRAGVDGALVDEVYFGTCIQAESALQTNVEARQAVLKAGLPPTTVSLTIDRACCSSMTAVQLGFRAIKLGADVIVAVGSESMGRAPFLMPDARWGRRLGHPEVIDPLWGLGYKEWNPVSVDAGEVALEYGVTREDQDRWALRSQQLYARALAENKFADEIAPFEVPQPKGPPVLFAKDEFPKPDTTLESLSKLKTVYGSPTVTAGNAPGLDTGSSALVLMSAAKAQELGIKPLARVVTVVSAAAEARRIATVPAAAIEKALAATGMSLDQMELIEINEAFAAMPLVSSQILAKGDGAKLESIRGRLNVNGGAIAIGHPVGASGARITMTLMYELRRRGGRYGIAAICGGLAQGDATLIEVAQ